ARVKLCQCDGHVVEQSPVSLLAPLQGQKRLLALRDVDHGPQATPGVLRGVPDGELRFERRTVDAAQWRLDRKASPAFERGKNRLGIGLRAHMRPERLHAAVQPFPAALAE